MYSSTMFVMAVERVAGVVQEEILATDLYVRSQCLQPLRPATGSLSAMVKS